MGTKILTDAEKHEKYKLDSKILEQALKNINIVIEDSEGDTKTRTDYNNALIILLDEMGEALELIKVQGKQKN